MTTTAAHTLVVEEARLDIGDLLKQNVKRLHCINTPSLFGGFPAYVEAAVRFQTFSTSLLLDLSFPSDLLCRKKSSDQK